MNTFLMNYGNILQDAAKGAVDVAAQGVRDGAAAVSTGDAAKDFAAERLANVPVEDMDGAATAFLLFALINWILVWGKYFVYFYFVLDAPGIATTVMASLGGAGSLEGIASLVKVFEGVIAKFTAAIPGGLLLSSIFNSSVTFWPMVYYRSKAELDPAKMGAYYSTCEAFFYTWWIVGWMPAGVMALDIFMPTPIGTGSMNTWNMIMVFGSAAEWFTTVIVLSIVYPSFDAWFLKNRIDMSKVVLKKYDSVELQALIKDDQIRAAGGNPEEEKKKAAAARKTEKTDEKKADGFDSTWSLDAFNDLF